MSEAMNDGISGIGRRGFLGRTVAAAAASALPWETSDGEAAEGPAAPAPPRQVPYFLVVTKRFPADRLAAAEVTAAGAIGRVNAAPVRAGLETDGAGTVKLRAVERVPAGDALRYTLEIRLEGWAKAVPTSPFDFGRLGWDEGGPPEVVHREIGWPSGGMAARAVEAGVLGGLRS